MDHLRPCILIVEGDDGEYDRLARAFGAAGEGERARAGGAPRLQRVRTGEAAVQVLRRLAAAGPDDDAAWPSVLILEARLPGLSGLRLLEWMRSCHRLRQLPVVFLTDRADPATTRAAYRAGANSCLHKPRQPEELARWAAAIVA